MKPTPGLVPQEGVVPVSAAFDAAGPMTKSVYDLAIVLDVLLGKKDDTSFKHSLGASWKHLSVATLDPDVWRFPDAFIKPIPGVDQQIVSRISYLYWRRIADS
jgi:amidase